MHLAKEQNVEQLTGFWKKLELDGTIYKVDGPYEDKGEYFLRIQPTFSIFPRWHVKVYIEEGS